MGWCMERWEGRVMNGAVDDLDPKGRNEDMNYSRKLPNNTSN